MVVRLGPWVVISNTADLRTVDDGWEGSWFKMVEWVYTEIYPAWPLPLKLKGEKKMKERECIVVLENKGNFMDHQQSKTLKKGNRREADMISLQAQITYNGTFSPQLSFCFQWW